MSRKENIKKALGISVYPWSSDDDEEQESSQMGTEMINNRQQQSLIDSPLRPDTPGPNGQSSAQASASGSSRRRNQMFWSRNSPRVEMPQLSVLPREGSGSGLGSGSASGYTGSLQRVLAFGKLHNSYPNYRSSGRPLCPGLGSSRGLMFSQPSTLPEQMETILRARRLARCTNTYDPTLNAAVIGESSNAYTRRATPESNAPVNVDQSDDDVELTEPAHRNEGNMESEAPEAGDAEADVPLAEGNNEEEQNTSAENDYQMNESENQAENETEPQPGTSSAPDNPQPQIKRGTKRRKENEDESPEPITVNEFNQNLLRLLECPVCLEWMEPPMSQCRRGHLVCGRCRARLVSCPVCRTAFSSVRNRAMEGVAEMVRYPCRHGCGREVRLRARAPHEASCVARRYRCPAPACHHRAALPRRDLATHLQNKHPLMVRVGWKHKISTKLSEERHENWVIMAMHQLFHLRLDVDIRTWGLVIYVAYIGPKCNASQYTYEVTIVGKHNRKMSYARSTHCDLECSTLNVGRQDCFHLTLEQAINFLRDSNKHGDHEKYLMIDIELASTSTSETNEEDG